MFASVSLFSSCDANFVEINKSPDTVYEVEPAVFLYQAENAMYTSGEAWADSYACKLRWMQYCTGIWGYSCLLYTSPSPRDRG